MPGDEEGRVGRPFVDEAGKRWNRLLVDAGMSRPDVDIFNIVDCKASGPASGAFDRLKKAVDIQRKKAEASILAAAEKQGMKTNLAAAKRAAALNWPSAAACCRRRLLDELEPYDNIIALGREAYTTLTGEIRSVGDAQGDPLWLRRDHDPDGTFQGWTLLSTAEKEDTDEHRLVKLMTTYNPAAVNKAPALHEVVVRNLRKAGRFFAGRMLWAEPLREIVRSPEHLARWLAVDSPAWSVDTETSGREPLAVDCEMVQFATPDLDAEGNITEDQWAAFVNKDWTRCRTIALLLVDEHGVDVWTGDALRRIQDIVRQFLEDPTLIKFGSNLTYYDKLVFQQSRFRRKQWLTADVRGVCDSLAAARFWRPDLPKGLKTQGTLRLDIGRWETNDAGERIATGRNTATRVEYGQTDAAVGARLFPSMIRDAAISGAFNEVRPVLDGVARVIQPSSWDRVAVRWGRTPVDVDEAGQPLPRPFNLWEIDHMAGEMCGQMHTVGIHIDQAERTRLESHYRQSIEDRRKRLLKLAVDADLGKVKLTAIIEAGSEDDADEEDEPDGNPREKIELTPDELEEAATRFAESGLGSFRFNSYDAVRDLLYGQWRLTMPPGLEKRDFLTKTGLPGTGDKVLRAHLAGGRLTVGQKAFLMELRLLRREANKILGTTLIPLRPRSLDREHGEVYPDGRFRPKWNAYQTAVARLSASRIQNTGTRKGQAALQGLFDADLEAGHWLFGFDLNQAHLVIAANYWKIPRMLEAFHDGLDVHNLLAYDIEEMKRRRHGGRNAFVDCDGAWPPGFTLKQKLSTKPLKRKKGQPADRKYLAGALREFYKTFRYLVIYAGEVMTAWITLTGTEDDDGNLVYIDTKIEDVEAFREEMLRNEPGWTAAWDVMERDYVANAAANNGSGFLTTPLFGRRSGILSDGKKNEIVNWRVLATESEIMRIAENQVIDWYPWGKEGVGTGIIAQIHDALKIEMKDPGRGLSDAMAKEARDKKVKEIEEVATIRIAGWELPFQVEGHHGRTLRDL